MLELRAALAGASEGASFRAPTCRVRDGWVFTTVSTNALLGLTFPLLLEASLTVTAGCVLSLLALYSVSALLPIRLRWPVDVPEPVPPSDSSTALQRGEASGGGFSSPLHLSSHRFAS